MDLVLDIRSFRELDGQCLVVACCRVFDVPGAGVDQVARGCGSVGVDGVFTDAQGAGDIVLSRSDGVRHDWIVVVFVVVVDVGDPGDFFADCVVASALFAVQACFGVDVAVALAAVLVVVSVLVGPVQGGLVAE